MTERESEDQYLRKRSKPQPRKMNEKLNKLLNYLIGIVITLIAITLFVIFSTEPEKVERTTEPSATEVEGSSEEATVPEEEEIDEDERTEEIDDQKSSATGGNVDVERVNDGIVSERWTSEQWEPYPTEQEGPHASIYQKGHIDYEEKLAAVYSVIPLEQSSSILLKIQNNGSPQTARAIVTSMDKTEIYRVFIEWVDSEGWLPTMVEVLTSLESIE